jgi:hypothetical protein
MITPEELFNKYFEKTENKTNLKNGINFKIIWNKIVNDNEYNNLFYREKRIFGGKNNFYKWLENNGVIVEGNKKIGKVALNLIQKNDINS